ncbi:hypothetical protein HK335_07535 [Streptococcus agalactiae]|nr:hypothetical protein [Streptococcus agalactiae]MCC9987167.1 hypothetical protein [Streptococcus agalactiae]MCC9989830.1 hypothetical protein [Streptococcus agalactiae]MCC9997174.1 hypothetical protein [Streptococcus agalactiae]OZV87547.1 hypothetical protein CFK62_08575 [Streptococcus agalactiae]
MSNNVISMLTKSIDAFIYDNEEQAHQVIEQDRTVNQEFDTIKKQLVLYFSVQDVDGEYPNRVFTRQELLDKVWGEQFLGETRTVDVHIGTLRTKLGEDGYLIATVRGVGYRLEERHD